MVLGVLQLLALSAAYHDPHSRLILRGTPTEFAKFDGIPPTYDPASLTSIELNNVEFEPAQLLSSLSACSSLESLRLRRVKWAGNFTSRLALPKLKEFRVQIKNMTFRSLDEERFKSLLFFDPAGEWKLQDLPKLGLNVRVDYGIQALGIDHERRSLELMHIPFSNGLLAGIKASHFPLTRLDLLFAAHLSVAAFPPTLTSLTLSNVNFRGGDLNALFKKLRSLEEVDLNEITSERFVGKTLDISELPQETLRSLFISSLSVTLGNGAEFGRLRHLRLMACTLEEGFGVNFGSAFKSLREVEIMGKEPVKGHALLKTVIQETAAEKVHFSNFVRDAGDESEPVMEMEEFLRRAKVPMNDQHFSLRKVKGQWRWMDPAGDSWNWRFWQKWI